MSSSAGITTLVFTWLVTYAVHSTLLLGTAWLAVRLLGRWRLDLQEAIWRTALLGGLLTATLQLVSGVASISGSLPLLASPGPEQALDSPVATFPGNDVVQTSRDGRQDTRATGAQLSSVAFTVPVAPASSGSTATPALYRSLPWQEVLLLLWLVGSVLAAGRLLSSWRRLQRLRRSGRAMPVGRLLRRLATRIGVQKPVRVSISEAISSPFATGVWRLEICLPAGAVDHIPAEQCAGLLAHELAHLVRCDPAWQVVLRVIRGVFFFQPLNRLAAARLEEAAECLCDDLAVARTGNRVGLARCLVHFAEDFAAGRPLPAAAAVPRTSSLARRVERILRGESSGSMSMRALSILFVGVLAVATVLLPTVSSSDSAHAGVVVSPGADAASFADSFGDVAEFESPPAAPAAPAAPSAPEKPDTPAPAAEPATPAAPEPAAAPEPWPVPEVDVDVDFERLEDELSDIARQLSEGMDVQLEEQIQVLEVHLAQVEETLELQLQGRMTEIEEIVRLHTEQLLQDEDRIREIRERALEIAEQVRPNEEEMKRLAEQARQMAEKISAQDIERLHQKAKELGVEAQRRAEELKQRFSAEIKAEARARTEERRRYREVERQRSREERAEQTAERREQHRRQQEIEAERRARNRAEREEQRRRRQAIEAERVAQEQAEEQQQEETEAEEQ